MGKSPTSFNRNLLTIALLCAVLAGVIYAMQYVRGDSFQASVGILFGPNAETQGKLWNWCPDGVDEVTLKDKKVTSPEAIRQICTVEVEADHVNSQQQEYLPLVRAASRSSMAILEANTQLDSFRVEGLPFRSQKLSEILKSWISKP